MIPHTSAPVWPEDVAKNRFASRIRLRLRHDCRVAILGLPDDLGVKMNFGRPGAAQGPTAFRAALASYGVAEPRGFDWPMVYDAGDVLPAEGETSEALFETHRRVTLATRAILDAGLFPIAIGGGHDLTLPFVRAVAERFSPLAGVYFDAHLDVRPADGSGMAFRRLIEDHGVGPIAVAGLNPLVNSREHVAWFLDHHGSIVAENWSDEFGHDDVERPGFLAPLQDASHLFCSFDLDVLDGASAPGVSAINPCGLGVREVARSLYSVASDRRLRCLDFMEFCPPHDVGGRTGRVAAHLFLHALMGLGTHLSPR